MRMLYPRNFEYSTGLFKIEIQVYFEFPQWILNKILEFKEFFRKVNLFLLFTQYFDHYFLRVSSSNMHFYKGKWNTHTQIVLKIPYVPFLVDCLVSLFNGISNCGLFSTKTILVEEKSSSYRAGSTDIPDSRHSSLSFITLGRSSGQHPISSHSCWMYVRAGRPAFARPCVRVHKSTSLTSSSLLLQHIWFV